MIKAVFADAAELAALGSFLSMIACLARAVGAA